MSREIQEPTQDGDFEEHPAWGMIGAYRVSVGPPGASLFDSDIHHHHIIRVRLSQGRRKRDIGHDFMMATSRTPIVEIDMSESQWASFLSTMNSGDGVPCTIQYLDGQEIPDFPHEARLALSMAETKDAAEKAFENIKRSFAALEALGPKAGINARRDAMRDLKYAIANAPANVRYAGDVLAGHAEDVVNKARADIEHWMANKANQLGLTSGDISDFPMLMSGDDEES